MCLLCRYVGLSPEDKVTLKKTYKLIVETVLAEDVVDRLQQSQVVKFSDRQEVLAIPKKQERMQVRLSWSILIYYRSIVAKACSLFNPHLSLLPGTNQY